jgi:TonB family protein
MKKIVVFTVLSFIGFSGYCQSKKKVIKKQVVTKKGATKPSILIVEKTGPNINLDTTLNVKAPETVYSFPDVLAEYPGGENNLLNYLASNINYPRIALDSNIQGRVVIEFQVCTDGQLCNLKIVKSLSKETDEEAIRVIKQMKTWKPAKLKGQPVASYYSLPISFVLEN